MLFFQGDIERCSGAIKESKTFFAKSFCFVVPLIVLGIYAMLTQTKYIFTNLDVFIFIISIVFSYLLSINLNRS